MVRSLHAGVLEKKGTFLAEGWEIAKSCLLPLVFLGLSHSNAWKLENNYAAELQFHCSSTEVYCVRASHVSLSHTSKTMHKISEEQWKYFRPTLFYFYKINTHIILYAPILLCMHTDFFFFERKKANKHQHSRLAGEVAMWRCYTRIKRQIGEVIQKPLSKYLPSFTHGNWRVNVFLALLLLNPKISQNMAAFGQNCKNLGWQTSLWWKVSYIDCSKGRLQTFFKVLPQTTLELWLAQ